MSFTAAQVEAGEAALKDLERERLGGFTAALGTWSASDSAKDAAVYFFGTTCVNSIAALRRRLGSDSSDFARWANDANDVHRSMADVAGYRSDWSMFEVLKKTARATSGDLGAAAQGVVEGAGIGAGVVTFLVLGYIALKVLR